MEFQRTHLTKRFQVSHLFFDEELSKNRSPKKEIKWHKGHPKKDGIYWIKNEENEFCRAFFFTKAPHWGSTEDAIFISDKDLSWAIYE